MKKNIIQILLGLILLLPILVGCNNTDDVASIFTGKKWKLTYITKANNRGWYSFPDVQENNLMEYINQNKTFTIDFTGTVEEDAIQGLFSGSGAVNTNGSWRANGKNNQFGMTLTTGTAIDSQDRIATKILEGLRKANSYGGDERNLYLYYQTNDEDLCLVFAPINN